MKTMKTMKMMDTKAMALILLTLSLAVSPAGAQIHSTTVGAGSTLTADGKSGLHVLRRAEDRMASPASTLEIERALDRVRKTTAPYLDLVLALADGWTLRYPLGCTTSTEGARAYHFLNTSLVDGEIDLLRPELLMYEPQEDGSMELIGVDYIVPFDRWSAKAPPTLLGQPFTRNEDHGVWALQVWAWRTNPSGLFAPWNPDVSCAHAW